MIRSVFAGRVVVLLLALSSVTLTAYSQEQPSPTPYKMDLQKEWPVLGAAATAAILPEVFKDHVKKSCPCDIADVNGLDRGTAGRKNDGIDKVSTAAVVGAVASPYAAIFVDKRTWSDAVVDGFVTGEAILVNVAFNQVIKLAAHRPRPMIYGLQDLPETHDLLNKPDNYFSFYSQHTSVVFAAGVSYARTFALRHPQSRRRWLVYTAAIGGGATVASLRVLAGRHFPTDVMTGAAAGTSFGLLIPKLHRKSPTAAVSIVPTRSGAAVSVRLPLG